MITESLMKLNPCASKGPGREGSVPRAAAVAGRILRAARWPALPRAQSGSDSGKANTNSSLCLHTKALCTAVPGPGLYTLGSWAKSPGRAGGRETGLNI